MPDSYHFFFIHSFEFTLFYNVHRYILDLKKEHKEQYVEKVIGMANSLGFKVQIACTCT